MYCGGSDEADSDITAKNRSDVNVLAVVNPKTRQILLVNTPRDYYLPLAFNGGNGQADPRRGCTACRRPWRCWIISTGRRRPTTAGSISGV